MPFDPLIIEFRATLDVMGLLLARAAVTSVRIATDSPPVAIGAVRRLAVDDYRIIVDSEEIQRKVAEALGIDVQVANGEIADAAFCPFSVDPNRLPAESTIVGATRNALSYRSVRYPGSIRSVAVRTIGSVRRQRSIDGVVGLYPPAFVALLAASRAAAIRDEARSLQLADVAMRYFIERGPMWRLCYVVAFAASR
jgi:hypothetical protein